MASLPSRCQPWGGRCGDRNIADAPPEVRAIYDDITATRGVDWINNFWKALAHHPPSLERVWLQVKEVMGTGGALDPVVKEMLYVAVSATNGCDYCVASHTAAARKAGMTDAMLGEVMAVVGLAEPDQRPGPGACGCRWTRRSRPPPSAIARRTRRDPGLYPDHPRVGVGRGRCCAPAGRATAPARAVPVGEPEVLLIRRGPPARRR